MSPERQPNWKTEENLLLTQRGKVAEEEACGYSDLLDAMEKKAEKVGPFFVQVGEKTAEDDRRAFILFEPLALADSGNKPIKLAVATASGLRCLNLQKLPDRSASELLQLLKIDMTINGGDTPVEKGRFSKETESLEIDQLTYTSIRLDPINLLDPVLRYAFVNSILFRYHAHQQIKAEIEKAIQTTASTRGLIALIAETNPPQTPIILS